MASNPVFLALCVISSLAFANGQGFPYPRLCGCQPFNKPVCGSNHQTYMNECFLRCDQNYPPSGPGSLYVLYAGKCKKKCDDFPYPRLCGCQPFDEPVCGSNHQTYMNECFLRCDQNYPPSGPGSLYVLYAGECDDCDCDD